MNSRLKLPKFIFYFFYVSAFFLSSCTSNNAEQFYILDSEKIGIDFKNTLTESKGLSILDYLYYYNGGGVAIGDINNDGLVDIFFTGNQVDNKLYLNQGTLTFKDITKIAGVKGNSDWNTGAIMGDVNGDGLLDIYVCAVVGINGFDGQNELFINNGNGTFTEKASEFGLDFDGYSSSAAFLDFDLDGDLDIYLLNHAVHNQESFGKSDIRNKRVYESGDKLLINDGNYFKDVSEKTGIFGGANGYGLGVAVSDFNKDGFPDLYISNDFHEDDYYYINNGNGTFTESLKKHIGHTSRFSMGNDVADINHDGFPDILTLDMLPKDEKILKSSLGDESISALQIRIENLGYHYQYSRNMLQINNDGNSFTEIGLQSGIAATDWSWSALFNDYDQDGVQDLFVTNGIPKRPNDLDYVNFISNKQIQKKLSNTKLIDIEALNLMPSGAIQNFFFKGTKKLRFIDKSTTWIPKDTIISNGAAYGDLDNDGDLDIVTNNLNSAPSVYINKTNEKANWLKVRFNYKKPNSYGIGTQVSAYTEGILQYKELYTTRGFQSSSEPIIHFGFGKRKKVDSLIILWPNRKKEVFKNVLVNKTLKIEYNDSLEYKQTKIKTNKKLFSKVENNLGIYYKHKENHTIDFNRQKLIPFQITDRGIATTIGDINNDKKPDILFGGSNREKGMIFIQKEGVFKGDKNNSLLQEPIYENVTYIIEDFDGDKKNDIFSLNGGGFFKVKSYAMKDQLFFQTDKGLVKKDLPAYYKNGSVAKSVDFDNDGDLDIFVGGGAIPNDYGKKASSYILQNNQGEFTVLDCEVLENIGIVNDGIWTDFDSDGLMDLIVVGEWMSPVFLKNEKNSFIDVSSKLLSPLNGLWQTIIGFDIDHDGDEDYLLGNWGINSKFKASSEFPMLLFYDDFDNNGSTETIVVIEKNGKYFTLNSLDELSSQFVSLIKTKFPNYKKFAGKTLYEVFDKKILDKAEKLKVTTLKSGYLKNENGIYKFVSFNDDLQTAPLTTFLKYDFLNTKREQVLIGGNYFGLTPFHGRLDGFQGALIKSEKEYVLGSKIGLNFNQKEVSQLNILEIDNRKYLIVTINNKEVEVLAF